MVAHFKTTFGHTAQYIVYDADISLDDSGKVKGIQYYRINCFSILFQRLKNEHDKWDMGETGSIGYKKATAIIDDYYDNVDSLEEYIKTSFCKLSEAVEKVLEFLENNKSILNITVDDIILKSLRPCVLGPNYMHPKYRGQSYCKRWPEKEVDILNDFIYMACPTEALRSLSDYQEKSLDFVEISRLTLDQNPIQFWTFAKKKHPKLAQFALDLLNIPAVMPNIDEEKLVTMYCKWFNDDLHRSFALTLVANEK